MRKIKNQAMLLHQMDSKKLCDEKTQKLLEQINMPDS